MSDQCKRQLVEALHRGLKDGMEQGSSDSLVFGDSLENLADDSAAEIIRARRFLDLLLKAIASRSTQSDSQVLNYIKRSLDGVSDALSKASFQLGRYYGNPFRDGKRASQGPSPSRVVDQWLRRQSEL